MHVDCHSASKPGDRGASWPRNNRGRGPAAGDSAGSTTSSNCDVDIVVASHMMHAPDERRKQRMYNAHMQDITRKLRELSIRLVLSVLGPAAARRERLGARTCVSSQKDDPGRTRTVNLLILQKIVVKRLDHWATGPYAQITDDLHHMAKPVTCGRAPSSLHRLPVSAGTGLLVCPPALSIASFHPMLFSALRALLSVSLAHVRSNSCQTRSELPVRGKSTRCSPGGRAYARPTTLA